MDNIEKIKREVLNFKRILNLSDFEIKLEKNQNDINYTKFFDKENTRITTSAIVWSKKDWKSFQKINAHISTTKPLKKEEIKWLLLKEIYKESIKILF